MTFNFVTENKLNYKGKYYRAEGYSVPTFNVEAKVDLHAGEKDLAVQYKVINAIVAEKKTVSHSVNIFLFTLFLIHRLFFVKYLDKSLLTNNILCKKKLI